jgi:hypothetical protein
MINKLTFEQEQQIKEYHAFYLAKGLSTQPANRPIAEKAVKEMYKLINEKEPKCIWVNSPTELIDLFKRNSLSNSLWDSLRDSLRDYLLNSLWDSLSNSLIVGQFYSPWISFYEYGRKVLCLEYSKEDNHKLNLWIDMLECSYFIVRKGLVVLMDHPLEFHVDNKGYTHNVSGYAIKFRDNTGIYVLHGQNITEEKFQNKEKLMQENKISKLEYLESLYEKRHEAISL